ncbi:radical SAM protein [bacterium (Candidatus Gribaldobacteria) CG_4_10_14_0_2_um_filter_33_15]|nr:MAG: radical SAM protein [bacterium (Candidatus Gribaldobacteria) CG10_big_fil_rev_8_21_14_0_10_33_41]PJA01132.1 MAG: radical SAM protein [bacterium (Candidatus Gribaldobacteria) CG_4_10_14_0_2_um_filter_33_15]PJB08810.1 MAG: radical SAM protein [bacterium (Candidatus Gribaldobacteria) CG_4_9_14_3_um_filter_33_9]
MKILENLAKNVFKQLNGKIEKGETSLEKILGQAVFWLTPLVIWKDESRQNLKNAKGIFLKGTGLKLLQRIQENMSPEFRQKFFENLVLPSIWPSKSFVNYERKYGDRSPYTVLISPTMRCNFKCLGCYADKYERKDDLPIEVVHRIIKEGEKFLSPAFWTILGGEPFFWEGIWEMFEMHPNSYFQVFTNGSLLEKHLKRLKSLGNVFLQISLEGFEEKTDARRGKGVFKQLVAIMDVLREERIPFGYSCFTHQGNVFEVMGEPFVDLMIEKGALVGWYFLAMPIGGCTPEDMPTPEQRFWMKEQRERLRETKPLFIVDFWNDAPFVNGCIAYAKGFCHINNFGDVEPCIFCHFATDNVKDKSLEDCFNSPWFKAGRGRQPFNENRYLPCQIIDNPDELRKSVKEGKAYPTHEGAEKVLNEFASALDKYAGKVKKLYTPEWEKDKKKLAVFCKKRLMI